MFRNLKKLRELKRLARSEAETEYDDRGRELIRMTVKEDDDFLSPYAIGGEEILSAEASEFLDQAVMRLPLKDELHVDIDGSAIAEEERGGYATAIRNTYRTRVIDIDRKLRRNTVAAIIMTVTAIVILALYLALELRNAGYVILEIVDIVAWVFMWEAADLFFLERNVLKLEQLRSCRLYAAEITFGETVKSASAKSADNA